MEDIEWIYRVNTSDETAQIKISVSYWKSRKIIKTKQRKMALALYDLTDNCHTLRKNGFENVRIWLFNASSLSFVLLIAAFETDLGYFPSKTRK